MEKKRKTTNEAILTKLALILPAMPDEGKERLADRIEGMAEVLEVLTGKQPQPPKATA